MNQYQSIGQVEDLYIATRSKALARNRSHCVCQASIEINSKPSDDLLQISLMDIKPLLPIYLNPIRSHPMLLVHKDEDSTTIPDIVAPQSIPTMGTKEIIIVSRDMILGVLTVLDRRPEGFHGHSKL